MVMTSHLVRGNEDTAKALRLASYNINNSDPAPTDLWENDHYTTEDVRNEFRYLAGAAEKYFGVDPGVKDMAAALIVATSTVITMCQTYAKVELDRKGIFTLTQAAGAMHICHVKYIPNIIAKDCKFLPKLSEDLWFTILEVLFTENNNLLKLPTATSKNDTILFGLPNSLR
jgi:methylmalonyl-CoA mutase cobalamin-binding subunit